MKSFFVIIFSLGIFSSLIFYRNLIVKFLPFYETFTLTVRVCNPYTGNLDIANSVYIYPQEIFSKNLSCDLDHISDGCKRCEINLPEGIYRLDVGGGYTGLEVVNIEKDKNIKLDVFGPVFQ